MEDGKLNVRHWADLLPRGRSLFFGVAVTFPNRMLRVLRLVCSLWAVAENICRWSDPGRGTCTEYGLSI